MALFASVGRSTLLFFEEVGRASSVVGRGLGDLVRRPVRFGLTLQQMERIGVDSLPIVVLAGVFTGATFTYESAWAAKFFGAEGLVAGSVGVALTRELGPTVTGLLVAGRAGSAMAAELGSMRISEQIDALTVMAVDPINYLVRPRLLASILVMPMLTMAFSAAGIFGSWLVCMYVLHFSRPEFVVRLQDWVDWKDIYAGLVKALAFGLIIGGVGCYKGLYTTGGAVGLGKSTTSAVVVASIAILVLNYVIAVLMPQ